MAASTVATLFADSVAGDLRQRKVKLNLAATGDTYQVVGAEQIYGVQIIGPDSTAITPTVTTDTVTFNYSGGGAKAGVVVLITYN